MFTTIWKACSFHRLWHSHWVDQMPCRTPAFFSMPSCRILHPQSSWVVEGFSSLLAMLLLTFLTGNSHWFYSYGPQKSSEQLSNRFKIRKHFFPHKINSGAVMHHILTRMHSEKCIGRWAPSSARTQTRMVQPVARGLQTHTARYCSKYCRQL